MKLNLSELAKGFISQDMQDLDTYIDDCISTSMEYNESIHECDRQQLLCDIELFIDLERYEQLKHKLESLDKEEREVLSDPEKEYGTYLETEYNSLDAMLDEEYSQAPDADFDNSIDIIKDGDSDVITDEDF